MIRGFLPVLLAFFLSMAGCTTSYRGITAGEPAGNGARLIEYGSFQLESADLPVFLGPVILSNFSVAMAERGYQPVTSGGDAIARISYVQEDLPVEQEAVRFIAQVKVELLDATSNEVIWSGSIQRLHTVNAGEYMHVGDASFSFLQAFRELISDVPARSAVPEQ